MQESGRDLKNKYLCKLFLSALAFILIAASCSKNYKKDPIVRSEEFNNYYVIWAHSDIQPRIAEERKYYEKAIDDINENFPYVNMSLVAGDVVHRRNSVRDFEWYNGRKKITRIKYWYEIAGNHDQKDEKNYMKYIGLPLHYSVETGNLLILCMSDEDEDAATTISDPVFEWWKSMVINNQDKIIITMTHGYLKESGLFLSFIESRNIKDSERFAKVLKEYKVDLWICGHTHLPHFMKGSLKKVPELSDTIFINVSAIREERNIGDPESFLLLFRKNSDELFIHSRNHSKKEFNDYYETEYKLSKKLSVGNDVPVMKSWSEKNPQK